MSKRNEQIWLNETHVTNITISKPVVPVETVNDIVSLYINDIITREEARFLIQIDPQRYLIK